MFGISKSEVQKVVEQTVRSVLEDVHDQEKKALSEFGTLRRLRQEIEALKTEKMRRHEEFEKREREIEHKVGLERTRQAFETDQAKRETTVKLREENLKADKERFAEEMKFNRERFEQEVGYLKDMVAKVLERLPSAEIVTTLTKDVSKAG